MQSPVAQVELRLNMLRYNCPASEPKPRRRDGCYSPGPAQSGSAARSRLRHFSPRLGTPKGAKQFRRKKNVRATDTRKPTLLFRLFGLFLLR
jgi:hypothetical protein